MSGDEEEKEEEEEEKEEEKEEGDDNSIEDTGVSYRQQDIAQTPILAGG